MTQKNKLSMQDLLDQYLPESINDLDFMMAWNEEMTAMHKEQADLLLLGMLSKADADLGTSKAHVQSKLDKALAEIESLKQYCSSISKYAHSLDHERIQSCSYNDLMDEMDELNHSIEESRESYTDAIIARRHALAEYMKSSNQYGAAYG